ncbi:ATP-binding protein [Microbacteriaceae bacterium K1510]|nr:ATP-binding protein [Microbacteriaceae bacterium K1510]
MSFVGPRFFNRIGGQMAVVVLLSLITIHAVAITAFYLNRHFEGERTHDEGPGQFEALVKLAAASPRGSERDAVIARIVRAFPHLSIAHGDAVQRIEPAHTDEPPAHFIEERLGPGFQAAVRHADGSRQIVITLPDNDAISARLAPPPQRPPFVGSPLGFTVLFIVVSMSLLLFWATRALRTPLSGFAQAAENFSVDRHDAALPERGPEEIRAVARALNRMRDRIRKLVDDRTRMLAAMGHDLRTPITRLRLRSEFIADEELRKQMLSDLDQMRAMTDGVLSFLRDGRAQEAKTTIDLASVLQTVCDQFADMGHAVSYAGPDHATIAARPDDLQRAVSNLVDNAVRHGTTVVVRLTAGVDSATITVEDDGPGIEDCRKPAMLEAFVRGEEARTMDDRAGFGLGLSIARAIAETHGGGLSLHDRVPHGLIARITLPAR